MVGFSGVLPNSMYIVWREITLFRRIKKYCILKTNNLRFTYSEGVLFGKQL